MRRRRALSARSRWPGTGSARRSFSAARRCGSLRTRRATTASLGDALVELGRYDEAFHTFDHMSSLRPDLSSYSRVSYARELLGRPDASKQAMTPCARRGRAASRSRRPGSRRSSASSPGRAAGFGEAESHYRAALSLFPGYVYALEPLALVQEAQGRHRRRALARAARPPRHCRFRRRSPRSVTSTHDTDARRAAKQQYALVDVIQRLLVANGVRTDLEIAQFDADHGVRLGRALAAARQARRARPSIDGDDVLGVGARAERPLRRGAALLAAGAPARHARRAQVLPSRDDRALPRTRVAVVVRQGSAR